MRRYRKVMTGILTAALILSSCSGPAVQDTKAETPAESTEAADGALHLTIATSATWEDSISGRILEKYQKELAEWSGGQMTITR